MRLLPVLLSLTCCACTHAQNGLRIQITAHSKIIGPGHLGEPPTESVTTVYVQGPRIRTESKGLSFGPMITIQHCDTRTVDTIFPDKGEYMEAELPSPADINKTREDAKKRAAVKGPSNLVIEIATVDTGETKEAFGHTARHYITTTKEIPSPELNQQPSESTEDVWYLDMPDVVSCEQTSSRPRGLIGTTVSTRVRGLIVLGNMLDKIRPEFRYSGPDPQGLRLSSRRTARSVQVLQTGEKQNWEMDSSQEIVNISEMKLDPKVFEVPAGYKKVKQLTR